MYIIIPTATTKKELYNTVKYKQKEMIHEKYLPYTENNDNKRADKNPTVSITLSINSLNITFFVRILFLNNPYT